MAQFRLSAQIMSRGGGRKVVAAAAYRSGDRLEDRHYGETQDYTNRRGVMHSEIVLPDNAPEWAQDRAELWSRVEGREKRADAQLAREVLLSLPCEMSDEQRTELTREFAQHVAAEYGMAVDMSIHAPGQEGDERNYHAHLMLPTRAFDDERADGWSKTKDARFDGIAMQRAGQRNAIEDLREAWGEIQNRALERAGIHDERGELVQVDHRSNAERGMEQEPTIHLGYAASGKQRRGEDSDRAQVNDEIRERNADRQEITQELESDRRELTETVESVRRTPAEDHLKYKYRNDPVMQAIYEDFGEGVARWMHSPEARQMGNARKLNEWMQGIDQADEQIAERQQQEQERERERQRSMTLSFGRSR